MTTRSPTFGQLLREAIEARLTEVHVSMPCRVVSYDSSKQTVTVQPLFKTKRKNSAGVKTVTKAQSIQNVPVAFPRCAGGWITFPLAADDVGMVVFAERSLNDWMKSTAGQEVEPSEDTMHPLNGAWFLPGGYPSKTPLDAPSTQHVVVHTESELHLGEKGLSADQFAAIGKLCNDAFSSIQTWAASHTHPGVFSGPSSSGPPATGPFTISGNPNVKATKVKVK